VLAKTNVAQALMMYESINPVFGRTLNPYNRSLIPGGSSGGEAALIALRGSAIGLASDYGGSIREPSTECGLYGLRPSWGRISFKDSSESFAGLEARHAVPGPIAHSPEDLDLYMSSYMAQKPWTMDHNVLNMPWSPSKMPVGPICFAIAYGDENVGFKLCYVGSLRY
jgi:amidase